MISIVSGPSPAGLQRRELRNWWVGLGGHLKDYCGVYNNGRHLFLSGHPPGTFFDSPFMLKSFSFQEGITACGDLRIVHRGHNYGLLGGTARISVLRNGYDVHTEIDIHAGQMAYIIGYDNKIQCRLAMLMLPGSVVPLV